MPDGAEGLSIARPAELESTARGAAMLAGVGCGLFRDESESAGMQKIERTFRVEMSAEERAAHRTRWADAIARSRGARP